MGLMGITANAGTRTIRTEPRLTKATGWAELKDMPVFDGTITVRHQGTKKSILTNNTKQTIIWALPETAARRITIRVKPGETKEVEL